MKSEIEKLSYSLGVNIGLSLKPQGVSEVNAQLLVDGITDAIGSGELKLSQDEIKGILDNHFKRFQERAQEAALKAQKDFFITNGKKEGVITTASGLQYIVLKEGSGPKPTIDSEVITHYHGTNLGGEVFDSSVERGEPVSFPVNGVISGWTEALQLMSVGSKWKLFLPSFLAYGERGAGAKIPPHAPLIFEVELLGVE